MFKRLPTFSPLALDRLTLAAGATILVGAAAIAVVQWGAQQDDHQNANILSMVLGGVSVIAALVLLQLAAIRRGRFWRLPIAVALVVAVAAAVLEYDGFSGEILPQFRFRFAGDPELPTVAPIPTAEGASIDPAFDSLGLLGTDRSGRTSRRRFAIPTDPAAVQVLWNQGIGEGWASFAVAGDRAVTLEQRQDLECVTCYRLSDGKLVWNVNHRARHAETFGGVGPRSTPTIDSGRVYAQGATGRVWCIDLRSGERVWTVDLLELAGWDQAASEAKLTWGRSGSPLIAEGLCIVPYGGPDTIAATGRTLIALDADSGEVRWTAGHDQPSYASPDLVTLAGVRQIVSVNEATITGHAPDDGQLLWEFTWQGGSNGAANCAKVVLAGPDRFLVGKGYGGGSALVEISRNDDGTWAADPIWESTRVLKTKFTHAVVCGDTAYALSNGSLEAVSVSDGERLWIQPRRSRFGQGQILIAEDTIVAQTEPGDVVLAAVNPQAYEELIRIPALEAKTWNIPTLAGRYLLVRNDRQAICLALPPRP